MVTGKRSADTNLPEQHHDESDDTCRPTKRHRVSTVDSSISQSQAATKVGTSKCDIISSISDEILVRILSFLTPLQLLHISVVSKHFDRIASDSQLWRPHFYRRFVLPRAHLIPGFRQQTSNSKRKDYKLRFTGSRSLWADGGYGRRGGGVIESVRVRAPRTVSSPGKNTSMDKVIDWRQAYKLRHNWEHGICAVEELQLHNTGYAAASNRTFAKFVEGLAVTVDVSWGLRIWDLRTKSLIAQEGVDSFDSEDGNANQPTCLALDGTRLAAGRLDVAVGFQDGTFGLWALDVAGKHLKFLRRHKDVKAGGLVSVAYLYPYIMTATDAGFILLYSFEHSTREEDSLTPSFNGDRAPLPTPYLLNCLKSRDTRPARALSIRRTTNSVVASFAWTFDTVGGWCIAVQDLDIRPSGHSTPDVITSRMASTLPTPTRRLGVHSPEGSPVRLWWPRNEYNDSDTEDDEVDDGPVRLSYNHPYLLVTMPDNTLILHICTATDKSLTISQGTRLFGHTSGISDAVITPGGKAVSVSSRGDEVRLWELEGGLDRSSVEVRPRPQKNAAPSDEKLLGRLDDKRNWVGFDEEMVIVLREKNDGGESFMVYDFT